MTPFEDGYTSFMKLAFFGPDAEEVEAGHLKGVAGGGLLGAGLGLASGKFKGLRGQNALTHLAEGATLGGGLGGMSGMFAAGADPATFQSASMNAALPVIGGVAGGAGIGHLVGKALPKKMRGTSRIIGALGGGLTGDVIGTRQGIRKELG